MAKRISKLLTYEQALGRFSEEEQRQMHTYFLTLKGPSEKALSKEVFVCGVLGCSGTSKDHNHIPGIVADRFFHLMGGGVSRGISWENYVVGLALLTRGSVEERGELLFGYYCQQGSASALGRDTFVMMTAMLEGTVRAGEAGEKYGAALAQLQSKAMKPEQFIEFVKQNQSLTLLFEWACVGCDRWGALEKKPLLIRSLVADTNFTAAEIYELELKFVDIRNTSSSGILDAETFQRLFSPPLPASLARALFRVFDVNKDGHCDFKEVVSELSQVRGDDEERLLFIFSIFDTNNAGYLTREQVLELIKAVWKIESIHQEEEMGNGVSGGGSAGIRVKDVNTLVAGQGRGLGDINELETSDSGALHRSSGSKGFHDNSARSSGQTVSSFQGHAARKTSAPLPLPKMMKVMSAPTKQRRNRSATNGFADGDFKQVIVDNSFEEIRVSKESFSSSSTQDIVMEKEDYLKWARKHPYADQLLEVIIQSCHIGFGLKPTSKDEAAGTIKECLRREANRPRRAGDKWYVLSFAWWTKWKEYVGFEDVDEMNKDSASKPGMIDNSDIILPENPDVPLRSLWGPRLKEDLEANKDYILVPTPVWSALSYWYGSTSEIPRPVVLTQTGKLEIELYPIHLYIWQHSNTNTGRTLKEPKQVLAFHITFSSAQTVGELEEYLCRLHTQSVGGTHGRMKPDCTRLWNIGLREKMTVFLNDFQTLEQAGMLDGQNLLFEIRNHDLSWPEDIAQIHRERRMKLHGGSGESGDQGPATQVVERGLTGLHNLGNTCYFNSAVQCVLHTEPLHMYFEKRYHTCEVNKANPLGMKGEVAIDFARLQKELWSGNFFSVAPLDFRETICKFSPQFEDFEQHDAQEFLAFLLDGLHEDLNRVTKKPYIELKDSDGRPDEEVSAEEWDAHVKRNNSVIVDLFHGQHRSEIKCPTCSSSSNRFDPFTFLTLSIPFEDRTFVVLFLYRRDGSPREAMAVEIKSEGSYGVIKKRVSEKSGIHVKNMLVAEVYFSTVYRYPGDGLKFAPLRQGGSLYVYEVADGLEEPSEADIRMMQKQASIASGIFKIAPRKRTFAEKLCCIRVGEIDSDDFLPGGGHNAREGERGKGFVAPSYPKFSNSIVGIHRSLVPELYSLNPYKPAIFGRPIFFTFDDSRSVTSKDLYAEVWKHVKMFLNADFNDVDPEDVQKRADNIHYPFELKYITANASACGKCPWTKFCLGCEIEQSDKPLNGMHFHIGIDWDPVALHLYYNKNMETYYKRHSSVDECRRIETESISLIECLNMYTHPEQMGPDDRWKCPECKVFRVATKTLSFWRLPPVFVIHLKRFQFVNGKWQKSQKPIDFPVKGFRPGDYRAKRDSEESDDDKDPVYDLYAVSNHIGYLGSGHYVTYAKIGDKWISFNDSLCKELKEDQVLTPSAYVLFYARRGLDWSKLMPDIKVPPLPMDGAAGPVDSKKSNGCNIL
eukprot:Nk52_evm39s2391 gene=Nk52_evmTU39s2391